MVAGQRGFKKGARSNSARVLGRLAVCVSGSVPLSVLGLLGSHGYPQKPAQTRAKPPFCSLFAPPINAPLGHRLTPTPQRLVSVTSDCIISCKDGEKRCGRALGFPAPFLLQVRARILALICL